MARFGVVRGAFYLYFSLLCSVMVQALAQFLWLKLGGSAENLLGVGPGIVGWAVFLLIAAILVIPRTHKFNEPIDLTKWFPLCVVATVLGVVSVIWMFSATFCVVCL